MTGTFGSDSGCGRENKSLKNGEAGLGIFIATDDPRNKSIRVPETLEQTVANAEMLAALVAVRLLPRNTPVLVVSGRDLIIKNLKSAPTWEDRGWVETRNKDVLIALMSELRARTAKTSFCESKGGQYALGCAQAQALASEAAQRNNADAINVTARPETVLRGAKLSKLTQSTAYKLIKSLREKVSRKATDEVVKLVQSTVKQLYLYMPTTTMVWKSTRHKDITRQIRSFLWRCLHSSLRIGKYWKHIPECEDRELCLTCGVTEDLDHIMVQCNRPGQAEVWKLAEKLWLKKGHTWPAPTVGAILGCRLATFKVDGRKSQADARLYTILMTESAHLIWKLRCEFVVGREGKDPASEREIHNRWVHVINERLEIDRSLTDQLRYGKQYSIAPSLVRDTWKGILEDEANLPDNWLRGPEVLVGIAPVRSQRSPPPPAVDGVG
ncbi:hypothetical protein B0H16DRAFT_1322072 [Mycena metata]|uniref:RNase H type-1 domain-containing protein n=1 Tax=Mycena metata TaxID=1033252 RepID=A0AAD7IJJ3_9AGAR|nr:hypothetical protein B0H16DRAFT_1322072 [Mycena metata]